MTDETPGPSTDPPNSPVATLAAAVLPPLLAVVAVAAVITSLYVWRQQSNSPDQTLRVATPRATASPVPHSSTPTRTTPPPSTPPASTAPPRSKSAVSTTPSKERSARPAKRLAVVVLNQTRRTGLARRVADVLRNRGWSVVAIGNFRGTVAVTTVYYPPGAQAQAGDLAQALAVAPRTRPIFRGLPTTRLTVVVTDNYPRQ